MGQSRTTAAELTRRKNRKLLVALFLTLPGCGTARESIVSKPVLPTPNSYASIESRDKGDVIQETSRRGQGVETTTGATLVGFRTNQDDSELDDPDAGMSPAQSNNDDIKFLNGDEQSDVATENTIAGFLDVVEVESTEPGTPVTLDELIATAVASHPSIAAARQKVAAALHRIPQATSLEDPIVGNTFWPIHDQALQTAGGRIGHQFSLSQKVPWPEKLDARGQVAYREVQVARAEVARRQTEITEAVRLAYYELCLAAELVRIVDDNTEIVEDLIAVSEARYRTGGSQQDVLRAELEGDRLAEQLIALRRQREQARADLGALVRMPMNYMPVAADELEVDEIAPQIEQLVAQAEQCNPTLQGLAAEIARDRAKESLACLQQYPDFQLGLGYSIVSDDHNVLSPVANGHDNINFSIGVTLPIWRDKINAGISEAAHNRSSATLRREAERDRLRGTLRRQVAAAYAAIEQLELLRTRLIPRTEQTLTISTADYQNEKADFTDLVATYRELLALQVQVARTKATLANTLAQIERTVGCPY
ncbi:TolC family protein [Rhodopirellula sp. JC740]|uniref:TolC family protein n=1 Tax=Rhodopirellula halodulae TaxID=2894198 RepID=A0ABS8NG48_9BACT|nr:TolC family protein [Rhodopirellula sp. JC740]MCC9642528.1 TolC family protein [Rhodopirellula sp. JC740]